jgi:hypothetical protein
VQWTSLVHGSARPIYFKGKYGTMYIFSTYRSCQNSQHISKYDDTKSHRLLLSTENCNSRSKHTVNDGPGSLRMACIHALRSSGLCGNWWNDSSGLRRPFPLQCGTQQCLSVVPIILYAIFVPPEASFSIQKRRIWIFRENGVYIRNYVIFTIFSFFSALSPCFTS